LGKFVDEVLLKLHDELGNTLRKGDKAQTLSIIPCIIYCDVVDKSERPSKDTLTP